MIQKERSRRWEGLLSLFLFLRGFPLIWCGQRRLHHSTRNVRHRRCHLPNGGTLMHIIISHSFRKLSIDKSTCLMFRASSPSARMRTRHRNGSKRSLIKWTRTTMISSPSRNSKRAARTTLASFRLCHWSPILMRDYQPSPRDHLRRTIPATNKMWWIIYDELDKCRYKHSF